MKFGVCTGIENALEFKGVADYVEFPLARIADLTDEE